MGSSRASKTREFSQFDLAAPPHAVPISAPNFDVTDKLASCITSQEATGQLDELEELETTFSMTTISPPSSSSSSSHSSSSLFTPPFWVNPTPTTLFLPPSTATLPPPLRPPPRLPQPLPGMSCYHRSRLVQSRSQGHMILWDLTLVIRFPLGATILVPSAILRRSNLPIRAHEKCFSFIQYTAGGLFWWILNGFQTDKAFENTGTKEEKMERTKEATTRWKKGVAMYSTVDSHKSGPFVPSI
ncbi:hypothetical protein C8F04DRAFT_1160375 [Mycena alexandri]|uniref:Uncharacterized protein n=2 Tax=Mycena alexandri TaxID=1745969 RepID=A0AAD6RX44_9AGAR|nr:hypothetical protein C8F04DRAFT_1160375 [Mycena alexandri]